MQTKTNVKIAILDVNDNFPEFIDPIHVLALEKLTSAGTQLAKFRAFDADEGNLGKVTFKLEDDTNDLFQISKNGKILLKKFKF